MGGGTTKNFNPLGYLDTIGGGKQRLERMVEGIFFDKGGSLSAADTRMLVSPVLEKLHGEIAWSHNARESAVCIPLRFDYRPSLRGES